VANTLFLKRSLILIIFGCTTHAGAEEFECISGTDKRSIQVEYDHAGWKLPCRVRYHKPAQRIVSYPWKADNLEGYCEEKAKFLAEKLENHGWKCLKKSDKPE